MKPGIIATQHFKRNLLLNLYREEKNYRWFVSSWGLREINMSGTCSLFPVWRPLTFLPVTLSAHQAPLPMGSSRQECWSGLPDPPPGDLPDPEIKLASFMSPALAGGFFTTSTTWEAQRADRWVLIDLTNRRKPNSKLAVGNVEKIQKTQEMVAPHTFRNESKGGRLKLEIGRI